MNERRGRKDGKRKRQGIVPPRRPRGACERCGNVGEVAMTMAHRMQHRLDVKKAEKIDFREDGVTLEYLLSEFNKKAALVSETVNGSRLIGDLEKHATDADNYLIMLIIKAWGKVKPGEDEDTESTGENR